jgi:hypothetical protein
MDIRLSQNSVVEVESDCVIAAANAADRRLHARHVKVMRIARLSSKHLDTEGLGMVRDISSGGMMVDVHIELEIGQFVTVALLDDQEITGEIVWKEDRTVGIHFNSEIPVDEILAKPLAKSNGKRVRLPRFTVNSTARILIGSEECAATIYDVSQRGAKIYCDKKMAMHSNILVKLANLRAVRATVKWRDGELTGVEFHRLLSVEELALWLKLG